MEYRWATPRDSMRNRGVEYISRPALRDRRNAVYRPTIPKSRDIAQHAFGRLPGCVGRRTNAAPTSSRHSSGRAVAQPRAHSHLSAAFTRSAEGTRAAIPGNAKGVPPVSPACGRQPARQTGLWEPPARTFPKPQPISCAAFARSRRQPLFPHFSRAAQEKSTWRCRQVLDLPTVFGRREWTRTIDPHHVKVGNADATRL